jgi:hypothetical protein
MNGTKLKVVEEETDIGVIVQKSLKPSIQCCQKAANMAMAVLRSVQCNFHYRDKQVFVKLYKQYIRPPFGICGPGMVSVA